MSSDALGYRKKFNRRIRPVPEIINCCIMTNRVLGIVVMLVPGYRFYSWLIIRFVEKNLMYQD